ncbi:MAG: thymidylate synthase [Fusobacterium sp.]|nr:thymidylate synthase [Fusobacterium sp.]
MEKSSKFDVIYKNIVNTIAEKGIWSEGKVRTKYIDGTPAHYKSYIGYQFRLDNSDNEAHLITSRFAPSKAPIRELYWIWLMQSNNVDELNKIGCKFWDEWKMEDGTIGKAYGYQIAQKTFQYKSQLDYVINELKNNPNSRRIMTEIWVPQDLDKMALTPCVHLTQWSVINGKLYLEVRQRSCDVALGLVANVFQYSVLHKLVALECGLEAAEIIWNIHNVHIYDRHYDNLLKQVNGECFAPAKLKINNFKTIYDFKPDDIEIVDYKHGEKVSYEVAI